MIYSKVSTASYYNDFALHFPAYWIIIFSLNENKSYSQSYLRLVHTRSGPRLFEKIRSRFGLFSLYLLHGRHWPPH